MSNTRKNKHRSVTRGWKKQRPSYKQRTKMLKRCGKKCFLGTKKSYPICTKNTCKINHKGVYSAYIRAIQQHKRHISQKAKKLLIKMGVKR